MFNIHYTELRIFDFPMVANYRKVRVTFSLTGKTRIPSSKLNKSVRSKSVHSFYKCSHCEDPGIVVAAVVFATHCISYQH